MKKFFAVFLMASVLAVLTLPVMATPVDPLDPDLRLADTPPATSGEGLLAIVDTLTNWLFAAFVSLAIIFLILAGLQFVSSGGDATKVSEARSKLIWAAVGIVVALASKGLVPVIRNIIGG